MNFHHICFFIVLSFAIFNNKCWGYVEPLEAAASKSKLISHHVCFSFQFYLLSFSTIIEFLIISVFLFSFIFYIFEPLEAGACKSKWARRHFKPPSSNPTMLKMNKVQQIQIPVKIQIQNTISTNTYIKNNNM